MVGTAPGQHLVWQAQAGLAAGRASAKAAGEQPPGGEVGARGVGERGDAARRIWWGSASKCGGLWSSSE